MLLKFCNLCFRLHYTKCIGKKYNTYGYFKPFLKHIADMLHVVKHTERNFFLNIVFYLKIKIPRYKKALTSPSLATWVLLNSFSPNFILAII